ncbi:Structural maintenance of chromosomes protein 3 [Senna tora]|uniref:Structural maintenance of chromosomes protein 3 n=1 Tax=Senna tora TaxID=362788 RepID=A0A834T5H6_9FABA|nr:Structural maintenance of chromosomes protein 3 [Senna tora]
MKENRHPWLGSFEGDLIFDQKEGDLRSFASHHRDLHHRPSSPNLERCRWTTKATCDYDLFQESVERRERVSEGERKMRELTEMRGHREDDRNVIEAAERVKRYKRRNIKELHKMLHRCNEQLQQFSHVNKKALDQYINFTEQREELQKRQAELDAGDEKIRELISVLDQRKDESIERTFKGVARHFREIFSELVQGGHGHLVMMKKKVSFTGQGETQSMKQLSGGQKTVVALTLIFAIQRCDPAPFYLFDEIDAALDPQYRTAVGNMIRRLADLANTQFITTTFRPELVKVADKIYGVTHKNRVSRVNIVSKEDALEFIEHDQTHNAE